ncbi:MAG TPA: hypothetical protein ENI90_09610 [Methylothermaceae bacterium]|nr:hypothetical protein [Methylothermaceae bacterium]
MVLLTFWVHYRSLLWISRLDHRETASWKTLHYPAVVHASLALGDVYPIGQMGLIKRTDGCASRDFPFGCGMA